MVDQLKKRTSLLNKTIAIFVLISFTLLNTSYNSTSYAESLQGSLHPHHGISQVDPMALIGSLKLPEELGVIQDQFIPPKGARSQDKLVIYIQGAHTNYDSETNTKKLIQFFQEQYGLPLVLLEGGEGSLDSLFFKSFPDEELKRKVLGDYVQKGELSGGEVASILNEAYDTRYYGIETQALYDENKEAFLRAVAKEKEITEILDQLESKLKEQSKATFSEKTKTFWDKRQSFKHEEIDLLKYVGFLKTVLPEGFPREENYPELAKVLNVEANEKRFKTGEFDAAMTKQVQTFQTKVLPKLSKDQQMEINQMIQMYRLGYLSQGLLVKRMEDMALGMNFFFETPEGLKPTMKHVQTLSSIKGSKLFEELEVLENKLETVLPKSEEERKLIENLLYVELLRNFARLEILHKDWAVLSSHKPSELLKVQGELDSLFSAHYHFYELALKRDEAMFENVLKTMKEEKTQLALVSTGGFHSEGITKKLKAGNIPYVLIAPKINQLGDRSTYLSVMQGHRSYMKYFNGSLWDALAQDYAAKLAASLKESELTPNLKRWRDRIIQNSIAEGRITQASSYTKYVDALVQALRKEYEKGSAIENLSEDQLRRKIERELNSFMSTYFERLESLLKKRLRIFSSGLQDMWQTGEINPQSIGKLLDRMSAVKGSNLATALVLIPEKQERIFGVAKEIGISKKAIERKAEKLKSELQLGKGPMTEEQKKQLVEELKAYKTLLQATQPLLSSTGQKIQQGTQGLPFPAVVKVIDETIQEVRATLGPGEKKAAQLKEAKTPKISKAKTRTLQKRSETRSKPEAIAKDIYKEIEEGERRKIVMQIRDDVFTEIDGLKVDPRTRGNLKERYRAIYDSRVHPLLLGDTKNKLTLEELGRRFGISRDKIRQDQVKIERILRRLINGHPLLKGDDQMKALILKELDLAESINRARFMKRVEKKSGRAETRDVESIVAARKLAISITELFKNWLREQNQEFPRDVFQTHLQDADKFPGATVMPIRRSTSSDRLYWSDSGTIVSWLVQYRGINFILPEPAVQERFSGMKPIFRKDPVAGDPTPEKPDNLRPVLVEQRGLPGTWVPSVHEPRTRSEAAEFLDVEILEPYRNQLRKIERAGEDTDKERKGVDGLEEIIGDLGKEGIPITELKTRVSKVQDVPSEMKDDFLSVLDNVTARAETRVVAVEAEVRVPGAFPSAEQGYVKVLESEQKQIEPAYHSIEAVVKLMTSLEQKYAETLKGVIQDKNPDFMEAREIRKWNRQSVKHLNANYREIIAVTDLLSSKVDPNDTDAVAVFEHYRKRLKVLHESVLSLVNLYFDYHLTRALVKRMSQSKRAAFYGKKSERWNQKFVSLFADSHIPFDEIEGAEKSIGQIRGVTGESRGWIKLNNEMADLLTKSVQKKMENELLEKRIGKINNRITKLNEQIQKIKPSQVSKRRQVKQKTLAEAVRRIESEFATAKSKRKQNKAWLNNYPAIMENRRDAFNQSLTARLNSLGGLLAGLFEQRLYARVFVTRHDQETTDFFHKELEAEFRNQDREMTALALKQIVSRYEATAEDLDRLDTTVPMKYTLSTVSQVGLPIVDKLKKNSQARQFVISAVGKSFDQLLKKEPRLFGEKPFSPAKSARIKKIVALSLSGVFSIVVWWFVHHGAPSPTRIPPPAPAIIAPQEAAKPPQELPKARPDLTTLFDDALKAVPPGSLVPAEAQKRFKATMDKIEEKEKQTKEKIKNDEKLVKPPASLDQDLEKLRERANRAGSMSPPASFPMPRKWTPLPNDETAPTALEGTKGKEGAAGGTEVKKLSKPPAREMSLGGGNAKPQLVGMISGENPGFVSTGSIQRFNPKGVSYPEEPKLINWALEPGRPVSGSITIELSETSPLIIQQGEHPAWVIPWLGHEKTVVVNVVIDEEVVKGGGRGSIAFDEANRRWVFFGKNVKGMARFDFASATEDERKRLGMDQERFIQLEGATDQDWKAYVPKPILDLLESLKTRPREDQLYAIQRLFGMTMYYTTNPRLGDIANESGNIHQAIMDLMATQCQGACTEASLFIGRALKIPMSMTEGYVVDLLTGQFTTAEAHIMNYLRNGVPLDPTSFISPEHVSPLTHRNISNGDPAWDNELDMLHSRAPHMKATLPQVVDLILMELEMKQLQGEAQKAERELMAARIDLAKKGIEDPKVIEAYQKLHHEYSSKLELEDSTSERQAADMLKVIAELVQSEPSKIFNNPDLQGDEVVVRLQLMAFDSAIREQLTEIKNHFPKLKLKVDEIERALTNNLLVYIRKLKTEYKPLLNKPAKQPLRKALAGFTPNPLDGTGTAQYTGTKIIDETFSGRVLDYTHGVAVVEDPDQDGSKVFAFAGKNAGTYTNERYISIDLPRTPYFSPGWIAFTEDSKGKRGIKGPLAEEAGVQNEKYDALYNYVIFPNGKWFAIMGAQGKKKMVGTAVSEGEKASLVWDEQDTIDIHLISMNGYWALTVKKPGDKYEEANALSVGLASHGMELMQAQRSGLPGLTKSTSLPSMDYAVELKRDAQGKVFLESRPYTSWSQGEQNPNQFDGDYIAWNKKQGKFISTGVFAETGLTTLDEGLEPQKFTVVVLENGFVQIFVTDQTENEPHKYSSGWPNPYLSGVGAKYGVPDVDYDLPPYHLGARWQNLRGNLDRDGANKSALYDLRSILDYMGPGRADYPDIDGGLLDPEGVKAMAKVIEKHPNIFYQLNPADNDDFRRLQTLFTYVYKTEHEHLIMDAAAHFSYNHNLAHRLIFSMKWTIPEWRRYVQGYFRYLRGVHHLPEDGEVYLPEELFSRDEQEGGDIRAKEVTGVNKLLESVLSEREKEHLDYYRRDVDRAVQVLRTPYTGEAAQERWIEELEYRYTYEIVPLAGSWQLGSALDFLRERTSSPNKYFRNETVYLREYNNFYGIAVNFLELFRQSPIWAKAHFFWPYFDAPSVGERKGYKKWQKIDRELSEIFGPSRDISQDYGSNAERAMHGKLKERAIRQELWRELQRDRFGMLSLLYLFYVAFQLFYPSSKRDQLALRKNPKRIFDHIITTIPWLTDREKTKAILEPVIFGEETEAGWNAFEKFYPKLNAKGKAAVDLLLSIAVKYPESGKPKWEAFLLLPFFRNRKALRLRQGWNLKIFELAQELNNEETTPEQVKQKLEGLYENETFRRSFQGAVEKTTEHVGFNQVAAKIDEINRKYEKVVVSRSKITSRRSDSQPSNWLGDGIEFLGHRSYAPPDDFRHIDWNLEARGLGLHVKEMSNPNTRSMGLLIDLTHVDGSRIDTLVNEFVRSVWVATNPKRVADGGEKGYSLEQVVFLTGKPGQFKEEAIVIPEKLAGNRKRLEKYLVEKLKDRYEKIKPGEQNTFLPLERKFYDDWENEYFVKRAQRIFEAQSSPISTIRKEFSKKKGNLDLFLVNVPEENQWNLQQALGRKISVRRWRKGETPEAAYIVEPVRPPGVAGRGEIRAKYDHEQVTEFAKSFIREVPGIPSVGDLMRRLGTENTKVRFSKAGDLELALLFRREDYADQKASEAHRDYVEKVRRGVEEYTSIEQLEQMIKDGAFKIVGQPRPDQLPTEIQNRISPRSRPEMREQLIKRFEKTLESLEKDVPGTTRRETAKAIRQSSSLYRYLNEDQDALRTLKSIVSRKQQALSPGQIELARRLLARAQAKQWIMEQPHPSHRRQGKLPPEEVARFNIKEIPISIINFGRPEEKTNQIITDQKYNIDAEVPLGDIVQELLEPSMPEKADRVVAATSPMELELGYGGSHSVRITVYDYESTLSQLLKEPKAQSRHISLESIQSIKFILSYSPRRSEMRRIKIPNTVLVRVKIVGAYVSKEKLRELEKRGFFKKENGSLVAPVMLDPRNLETAIKKGKLQNRSVHSDEDPLDLARGTKTTVAKGSGTNTGFPGILYTWDDHQEFPAQYFRGGETKKYALEQIDMALRMRRAYAKGISENDSVLAYARKKYGIKEAPFLKPLFLLKPLRIPILIESKYKQISPYQAFMEGLERDTPNKAEVARRLARDQVIFVYEVPLNERVKEIGDIKSERGRLKAKLRAVYGNPKSKQEILEKFSARLAVGVYINHDLLHQTLIDYDEEVPGDHPPLASKDVTISGHIVDLNKFREIPEDILKNLQKKDHEDARSIIREFAQKLDLRPDAGLKVYDEILYRSEARAEESALSQRKFFKSLLGTSRRILLPIEKDGVASLIVGAAEALESGQADRRKFLIAGGSFLVALMASPGVSLGGGLASQVASDLSSLARIDELVDLGRRNPKDIIQRALEAEQAKKVLRPQQRLQAARQMLWWLVSRIYSDLELSEQVAMYNLTMYAVWRESGFAFKISREGNKPVLRDIGMGQTNLGTIHDRFAKYFVFQPPAEPKKHLHKIQAKEGAFLAERLGLPSRYDLTKLVHVSQGSIANIIAYLAVKDDLLDLFLALSKLNALRIDLATGRRKLKTGEKSLEDFARQGESGFARFYQTFYRTINTNPKALREAYQITSRYHYAFPTAVSQAPATQPRSEMRKEVKKLAASGGSELRPALFWLSRGARVLKQEMGLLVPGEMRDKTIARFKMMLALAGTLKLGDDDFRNFGTNHENFIKKIWVDGDKESTLESVNEKWVLENFKPKDFTKEEFIKGIRKLIRALGESNIQFGEGVSYLPWVNDKGNGKVGIPGFPLRKTEVYEVIAIGQVLGLWTSASKGPPFRERYPFIKDINYDALGIRSEMRSEIIKRLDDLLAKWPQIYATYLPGYKPGEGIDDEHPMLVWLMMEGKANLEEVKQKLGNEVGNNYEKNRVFAMEQFRRIERELIALIPGDEKPRAEFIDLLIDRFGNPQTRVAHLTALQWLLTYIGEDAVFPLENLRTNTVWNNALRYRILSMLIQIGNTGSQRAREVVSNLELSSKRDKPKAWIDRDEALKEWRVELREETHADREVVTDPKRIEAAERHLRDLGVKEVGRVSFELPNMSQAMRLATGQPDQDFRRRISQKLETLDKLLQKMGSDIAIHITSSENFTNIAEQSFSGNAYAISRKVMDEVVKQEKRRQQGEKLESQMDDFLAKFGNTFAGTLYYALRERHALPVALFVKTKDVDTNRLSYGYFGQHQIYLNPISPKTFEEKLLGVVHWRPEDFTKVSHEDSEAIKRLATEKYIDKLIEIAEKQTRQEMRTILDNEGIPKVDKFEHLVTEAAKVANVEAHIVGSVRYFGTAKYANDIDITVKSSAISKDEQKSDLERFSAALADQLKSYKGSELKPLYFEVEPQAHLSAILSMTSSDGSKRFQRPVEIYHVTSWEEMIKQQFDYYHHLLILWEVQGIHPEVQVDLESVLTAFLALEYYLGGDESIYRRMRDRLLTFPPEERQKHLQDFRSDIELNTRERYLRQKLDRPEEDEMTRMVASALHRLREPIRAEARILVVDDKEAEATKAILVDAGYKDEEVVTAESREEASRKFSESLKANAPFDLVISDLQIGPERGDEFLNEVSKAHPNTKLILLTGKPEEARPLPQNTKVRKKSDTPAPVLSDIVKEMMSQPVEPSRTTSGAELQKSNIQENVPNLILRIERASEELKLIIKKSNLTSEPQISHLADLYLEYFLSLGGKTPPEEKLEEIENFIKLYNHNRAEVRQGTKFTNLAPVREIFRFKDEGGKLLLVVELREQEEKAKGPGASLEEVLNAVMVELMQENDSEVAYRVSNVEVRGLLIDSKLYSKTLVRENDLVKVELVPYRATRAEVRTRDQAKAEIEQIAGRKLSPSEFQELVNLKHTSGKAVSKLLQKKLKLSFKMDRAEKIAEIVSDLAGPRPRPPSKPQTIARQSKGIDPRFLDPTSSLFDIELWVMERYFGSEESMGLTDKTAHGQLIGEDLKDWFDKVVRPLKPDFDYQQVGIPMGKEKIEIFNFHQLSSEIVEKILIPRGFFFIPSTSGDEIAMGHVLKGQTEFIVSPAGRRVPIYLVKTITPVSEFGEGIAKANFVALPTDNWLENIIFSTYQGLQTIWSALQKGQYHLPSFKEDPAHIQPWIKMNFWKGKTFLQAKAAQRQITLAEELSHSDTEAFVEAMWSHRVIFSRPGEAVKMVQEFLKADASLRRVLEGLNQDPKRQEEFARAVIEVEGKLSALVNSPYPAETFVEFLMGIIIPGEADHPEPSQYPLAREHLLRLLSEPLIGSSTLDKEAWLSYLDGKVRNLDLFNQELRKAAELVYPREFLTKQERNHKLQLRAEVRGKIAGESDFDLTKFNLPEWARGFEKLSNLETRIFYAIATEDAKVFFSRPLENIILQTHVDSFMNQLNSLTSIKEIQSLFDKSRSHLLIHEWMRIKESEKWKKLGDDQKSKWKALFQSYVEAFYTLQNKVLYARQLEKQIVVLDRLDPVTEGHSYPYVLPTEQLSRIMLGPRGFHSDRAAVFAIIKDEIRYVTRDGRVSFTGEPLTVGQSTDLMGYLASIDENGKIILSDLSGQVRIVREITKGIDSVAILNTGTKFPVFIVRSISPRRAELRQNPADFGTVGSSATVSRRVELRNEQRTRTVSESARFVAEEALFKEASPETVETITDILRSELRKGTSAEEFINALRTAVDEKLKALRETIPNVIEQLSALKDATIAKINSYLEQTLPIGLIEPVGLTGILRRSEARSVMEEPVGFEKVASDQWKQDLEAIAAISELHVISIRISDEQARSASEIEESFKAGRNLVLANRKLIIHFQGPSNIMNRGRVALGLNLKDPYRVTIEGNEAWLHHETVDVSLLNRTPSIIVEAYPSQNSIVTIDSGQFNNHVLVLQEGALPRFINLAALKLTEKTVKGLVPKGNILRITDWGTLVSLTEALIQMLDRQSRSELRLARAA